MNRQDAYRRYEAGVWAVPLALLPSFFFSAAFGQPSCVEPMIEVVIAHTPLGFAHFVLNTLGPLARPLALVGAVAIIMTLVGLFSILAPPIVDPKPSMLTRQLRWFSLTAGVIGAGIFLGHAASTPISAFSAIFAGVLFVPILLWTRRWRLLQKAIPQLPERRKVVRSLLGTPLVTFSLVTLSSYELWSNAAVHLFSLGNPVRRLFTFIAPKPRRQGFPIKGTEPEVTAVPQFYINGKNATDPLLLEQDWELRITGLVRTPLTLTFQHLLEMPRTSIYVTMRCVDNLVDGHLMSTAYWSGVRLSDVLALAQPLSQATTVMFRAADDFAEPFALAEPSYDTALLVYAMNGETLTQVHGAPVRVLLPGWYGFRNVKWLQGIELTGSPVDGYWEHNGWQAKKTHEVARIDTVQPLDDTHVLVAGVAFGGLRGISKVQVRIDAGEWAETELNTPALSDYTWVQWRAVLAAKSQQFHVTARMIDAAGVPQDKQAHDPYPNGSSGLHTIEVKR